MGNVVWTFQPSIRAGRQVTEAEGKWKECHSQVFPTASVTGVVIVLILETEKRKTESLHNMPKVIWENPDLNTHLPDSYTQETGYTHGSLAWEKLDERLNVTCPTGESSSI